MSIPRTPDRDAPSQPRSSVESSGHTERRRFPVTRPSFLARRLRLGDFSSHPATRRKREMIPADKKDATYWVRRLKNNEAAKRSRERRRLDDLMLGGHLLALTEENAQLRAQLQYHARLGIESRKAASTCAPPVFAFSPGPAHTPALVQTGLWGLSSPVTIPCFSTSTGAGVLNPLNHDKCGAQQGFFPLPTPRDFSPREAVGGGRSVEVEADSQAQLSSSDAPSHPPFSLPAFLPSPDTLHYAPTLSYPPQNWLVPHLNPSTVRSNPLWPWRSSYLAPTQAVHPGLPLHTQESSGQGVGAEAQRAIRSWVSSAP